MIGLPDASFAINHENTNQIDFTVFLADKNGNTMPIHYKSYMARCIVRSGFGDELIAFSNIFDYAISLGSELRRLHPQFSVPVCLHTNCKSLFDFISKYFRTSEHRVILGIAAAQNGFKKNDISDIELIRSGDSIADGLTKRMSHSSLKCRYQKILY